MKSHLWNLVVIFILLVTICLTSCTSNDGCGNRIDELTLDSQAYFMFANYLELSTAHDVVEDLEYWGLNAEELRCGRHVKLDKRPGRGESQPYALYDEIEHVVKVYKDEKLAKEAFDEWNEPIWGLAFIGAYYPLNPFGEPGRHDYKETSVGIIGDESKAWITTHWEGIIVFRKGAILEAVAMEYFAPPNYSDPFDQWWEPYIGEITLDLAELALLLIAGSDFE